MRNQNIILGVKPALVMVSVLLIFGVTLGWQMLVNQRERIEFVRSLEEVRFLVQDKLEFVFTQACAAADSQEHMSGPVARKHNVQQQQAQLLAANCLPMISEVLAWLRSQKAGMSESALVADYLPLLVQVVAELVDGTAHGTQYGRAVAMAI